MSTTLTIRNLPEPVKQKLRTQAASHGRSMEAEAREILTRAVTGENNPPGTDPTASKGKFDHLIGIWKGRMTTDEIMELTRGD
jgi:plasmid stability protein